MLNSIFEKASDGYNMSMKLIEDILVISKYKDDYLELCKKGLIDRPHYGLGVFHAAWEAKNLGYDSVSVIEFGVASGEGLLNLETHAKEVERQLNINIEIYGFDTGGGLPEPKDYKDMPFKYHGGKYEMDVGCLKPKLKKSELILGDVKKTVPEFQESNDFAPVGAIFHDLDYYSSTIDSFKIFNLSDDKILPRVVCYFDDISGKLSSQVIPQIGEEEAIQDFNKKNKSEKIGKLRLKYSYQNNNNIRSERWYSYHRFNHQKYDQILESRS